MKKLYVNWEEFEIMINKLVEKIKKSKIEFNDVYGIPRGGLPIAVCLSHKLGIPITFIAKNNTLVCDDISDKGRTLKLYSDRKIATLFSTDWTITKPDWFVDKKLNKDEWIVFPWEEK